MSSSSSSSESLTAAVLALPHNELIALMTAGLKSLKSTGRKAASKAANDPAAPKREPTWWIKGTQYVLSILNESGVLVAENARREAAKEKKLNTAHTQVASMLKEAGHLTADITPTAEQVSAAWRQFLESPPPTKTAELKAAAASRSTASAGSKGSKASNAELSEEEKEVKRKETAAKRAAKIVANKAKKAAETAAVPPAPPSPKVSATKAASVPLPLPADEEEDEEAEVEPYEWEHAEFNLTNGAVAKNAKSVTYERVDIDGMAYIYDNTSKKFLGQFIEKVNKLNPKADDPLA
jgi:hypothetical protein